MDPGQVAIFAERAGEDICWHPDCFSCWECGEVLEDLLYYYTQARLRYYNSVSSGHGGGVGNIRIFISNSEKNKKFFSSF